MQFKRMSQNKPLNVTEKLSEDQMLILPVVPNNWLIKKNNLENFD